MTNSGNCSRATQQQITSVISTQSETEFGSISHGQAASDDQLAVDEILDRFTLALARQLAREDHDNALSEGSMPEVQQQ